MADVDEEFVTVLLQINLAIRTDFFRALFYCTVHKSRIKQRALVANVATNFRILVANTENLGALATVSGAISCPVTRPQLSSLCCIAVLVSLDSCIPDHTIQEMTGD